MTNITRAFCSVRTSFIIFLTVALLIQPLLLAEQQSLALNLPSEEENPLPSEPSDDPTQDTQKETVKLAAPLEAANTADDPWINFTRSGAYASQWSICLDGMRIYTSTSSILFSNLPDGNYSYTAFAETNGWIATPSSGYAKVAGSNITINITFTANPTVTFTRTGSYTSQWSVCFEGNRIYTSTSTISFPNVPNGTYYYTTYAETNGWTTTPSTGTITVTGSNVNVNIAFTPLPTITFTRTGSYTSQWSVCLNGMRSYTSTSTIAFTKIPNGTYYYTVYAESNGWTTTPSSGTITITGSNITIPVTFTTLPTVTFTRTGYTGQWSVFLNGMRSYTSTSTITFTNVPNGVYSYRVCADSSGWTTSPPSGTITITGSNVTQPITFNSSPITTGTSTITITQTGLPAGTLWGVSLAGSNKYSTTDTIQFTNLANGAYPYVIIAQNTYAGFLVTNPSWQGAATPSPPSGSINLQGTANLNINFATPQTLTFTQTGLTSLWWSVSANGMFSGWTAFNGGNIIFYNVPQGADINYVISDNVPYSSFLTPTIGYICPTYFPYAATIPPTAGVVNTIFYPSSTLTFAQKGLTKDWWSVSANGMFSGWQAFNGGNITFYNVPQSADINYVISGISAYASNFLTANPALSCPTFAPYAGVSAPTAGFINTVFSPPTTLTFTQSGLGRDWWSVSANGMFSGWQAFNGGNITFYNVPQSADINYVISDANDYIGFLGTSYTVYYPSTFSGSITTPGRSSATSIPATFRRLPSITFTELNLPSGKTWTVNLDGQSQTTYSNTITFINAPYNNPEPFQITLPPGLYAVPTNGTINVGTFDAAQLILITDSPTQGLTGNAALTVQVTDTSGKPVPGIYAAFYDENQIPLGLAETDASGYAHIEQLPNKIFLGAITLKQPYSAPMLKPLLLSSGPNTASLQITPFPTGSLTGTVTYLNGTNAPNVQVTTSQTINGITFANKTQTNANGQYSISLLSGIATVRASAIDFYATLQNVTIPTNNVATLNIGLAPFGTSYITINIYVKFLGQNQYQPFTYGYKTAHSGQDPILTDYFGSKYDVDTTPFQFKGYTGEPITATWNGQFFGLPKVTASTTLDANRNGTISLYAAQLGQIIGNVVSGSPPQPVNDWNAKIYLIDPTGIKTFVTSVTNTDQTLAYSPSQAGTYEFDITSVDDLTRTLYGTVTTAIQGGQTINLGNINLTPGIYFAGKTGNSVQSTPQQTTPGATVTIRATYSVSGLTTSMHNASLLLEIPAQTTLLLNSISINSTLPPLPMMNWHFIRSPIAYEIPMGDFGAHSSGTITYQLLIDPTYNATNLIANAYISYDTQNGHTQETLGTADIRITQLTINAPQTLSTLTTIVSGEAPTGTRVDVYDNQTFLGQTTVPMGTFWQMKVTLPNQPRGSTNLLHAQADTQNGKVNSETIQVTYDDTEVTLTKMAMWQTDGRKVTINPQQDLPAFAYVIHNNEPITFALTFSNPSKVTDVQIFLGGYDGQNATLRSDGTYQTTFNPPNFNWGTSTWDGTIDFGYVPLPLPLPQTPDINSLDFKSIYPNSNITFGNETQSTFDYIITGLPADASIKGNLSLTANVTYAPPVEDLEIAQLEGTQVFNVNAEIVKNTTTNLASIGSIFIPYSAMDPSLANFFGHTNTPSSPGLPLEGILISFYYDMDPDEIDVPADAPYTIINDILKVLGKWGDLETELRNVINAAPNLNLKENGKALPWLRDIQKRLFDYHNRHTNAVVLAGIASTVIGVAAATKTGFWGGLIAGLASGLVIGSAVEKYFDTKYNLILNQVRHAFFQMVRESAASGVFYNKDDVAINKVQPLFKRIFPKMLYTKVMLLRDPSGFVYEGVTISTVANVTATLLYRDQQTGTWTIWDAAAYGQQNNQLTDGQGKYGWDVPTGEYVVLFQKSGYQTAQSRIVDVPPPATDVNMGITPLTGPNVQSVTARTDGGASKINVKFTQYMKATTLNHNTIIVTLNGANVAGSISPLSPQQAPNGIMLTNEVTFTPSTPFTTGTTYTVYVDKSVENFANTTMPTSYSAPVVVQTGQNYALTIFVIGSGTVTPGNGTYASGSTATIQASNAIGWSFQGWSGDLTGNTTPTNLIMTSDKTVTATFTQDTNKYTITFTETGLPSGTAWNVTFNGVTTSATTPTITFTNIAAGTYQWATGTPITGGSSIRYNTQQSSASMNVPTQTTQTITFNTQYQVSFAANPSSSGTVNPTNTMFCDAGSNLPIAATGSGNYIFQNWTSTTTNIAFANGNSASTNATVNGPGTITASFTYVIPEHLTWLILTTILTVTAILMTALKRKKGNKQLHGQTISREK